MEKYVCDVQSSIFQDCVLDPIFQDCVLDPAELDLKPGQEELELCFSRSQVRDPAYALLDSGGGSKVVRVFAEDRAHPLLPLGQLANLLDTKCIWENGEAPTHAVTEATGEPVSHQNFTQTRQSELQNHQIRTNAGATAEMTLH